MQQACMQFVHIGNLKQTLNNRLVLKKVHKVIQFNQKVWLKLYSI